MKQTKRLAAAVAAGLGFLAGAAAAADWPQWRGPNRDGVSTETGFLKQWPEGGPTLLWTARGIGEGFSTVAIADGVIYTAGNLAGHATLTALDLAGKTLWQTKLAPAHKVDYPGTRGTPTIDGGRVYCETPDGTVSCLEAKDGKVVWALNILEKFKGRNITWALAESVLIDGEKLICCPGGAESAMVALDKKTGDTLWVCKGAGDKPGYASPIVVDYQGLRQYVTMTSHAAIGVHAATGELLWRVDHKTSWDANIPDPIYHDGHVFINSGYGSGGALLRLKVDGQKCSVEQLWRTKAIDNHHGGIILVGGHLYGAAHNGKWVCLDFKTGEVKYSTDGVGKGSLTYADGMLYTYSERGAVGLVRATPNGHQVISRFRVPQGGRGPNWPHPVVCGGRLYLRHGDLLFAYDIKGK